MSTMGTRLCRFEIDPQNTTPCSICFSNPNDRLIQNIYLMISHYLSFYIILMYNILNGPPQYWAAPTWMRQLAVGCSGTERNWSWVVIRANTHGD